MFDAPIDPLGLGSRVALMAPFGAGLGPACLGRGLLEGGQRTGGGVRRPLGREGRGQCQQLELDGEGILLGKRLGLGLGQRASAKGAEELGVEFGADRD